MKARLDMDRIAKGLGAQRQGRVVAKGGYFGGLQLLALEKTTEQLNEKGAERLVAPKKASR